MEGHGLVRERVERFGREVVARGDLELERRVVLHLAACLADEVDGDERDDVGAEHLEDLVGCDGLGAHAVDDHAHEQRVAVAEQHDEADGREHEAYEQPQVFGCGRPVVVERAPCRRYLVLLCHGVLSEAYLRDYTGTRRLRQEDVIDTS